MESRIDILEKKIDQILFLLEDQKKIQTKLEKHIDFIEITYEQLYTPLTFMKQSVYRFLGKPNTESLQHIK